MIIVEGPDGAGKTTLVNLLGARYGLEVGTRTSARDRLWETTVQDTFTAMEESLNPRKPPKVWDRMLWSEIVYAPVMGRRCAFSRDLAAYCMELIYALGTPIIWCMPPLEIVKANVETTDQHSWVVDNIEDIYDRYRGVFAVEMVAHKSPILYDYTGSVPEADIGLVLRVIDSYIDQFSNLWKDES